MGIARAHRAEVGDPARGLLYETMANRLGEVAWVNLDDDVLQWKKGSFSLS